jgi:hypothetical protein
MLQQSVIGPPVLTQWPKHLLHRLSDRALSRVSEVCIFVPVDVTRHCEHKGRSARVGGAKDWGRGPGAC